jgi:hypothetical protein
MRLTEFSPDTLDGSFTKDLIFNKLWLISELQKLKDHFSTIYVLGSWYGNMGLLLAKSDITFDHIVNVDTDSNATQTSERIVDLMGLSDKIEFMVKDVNQLDYRQLDGDGLVINTSCHDIKGHAWFDNIPAGTMVAVQSRTDVDDDLSGYEFSKLLYKGSIELADPETEYTSLLKIGIK